DSGAPAVLWSVSENGQSGQFAGGTAGSKKESEYAPCNPEQQPSVGESSAIIPSPSYSTGHT
ncbi:hypothetical protein A2U01_0113154, partial [Trifolium medium]|nr:hypothetical protein [Trifolium medium]